MGLNSRKNLLFQRLFQEVAVIKNNISHGIKCHQGTEQDDYNHIDIIYENGETEDCKYCGKNGVFINEGTLTSKTTWISSIIGNTDYKVKREKIYNKYKNNIQYDEKYNENRIYVLPEDFKKLASKQFKVDDDCMDWYEQGKKITYYGNRNATVDMVCEKLENYVNTHKFEINS